MQEDWENFGLLRGSSTGVWSRQDHSSPNSRKCKGVNAPLSVCRFPINVTEWRRNFSARSRSDKDA